MKAKQLIVRRVGILTATAAMFSLIIWSGSRTRSVATSPKNAGTSSRQTPPSPASHRAVAKLDHTAIPPQKYVSSGTRFTSPVPDGLTGPEWDSISGKIEDSEYAFQLDPGSGQADAANREQRIKTSLNGRGVRVTPYAMKDGKPAWHWCLQMMSVGATGEAIPLAATSRTTATGRRAEVTRGIVTEWCENRRAGVEQGFTIHHAPANTSPSDGELRLDFRCQTTLKLKAAGPTTVHWMDESGEVILRYSGLYAYDANAIQVPAEFHIEASDPDHLCIALNTEGAAYPITIDPLIATKQQKFTPTTGPVAHFGFAVAMHGDVCVIGAPSDDPAAANPAISAGVVHLFGRDAATREWQVLAHVVDPMPNSNRAFGAALDWNGHTLVIGSPAFHDVSAPAPASTVGAHILNWGGKSAGFLPGARVDLVDPEGASQSSGFGESVAVSGTGMYVAVGSPRAYSGGSHAGGRVMIYPQLTNGSYATTPSPLHDSWGNQVGADWGKCLSFDKRGDSRLAVGSPGYNQPAFPNGGRVLVLDVAENGVGETTITPFSQGYHTLGYFGSDVSLDGKRLAVGHPGASISFLGADGLGITVPSAGFVHVYELGTQWEEIEGIPSPDPQVTEFGRRVSLDDDRLVVDSNSLSHGYDFQWSRWIPTFRYPDFVIPGASLHPSVTHGDQVLFGNTGEIFRLQGNGWCHLTPEYPGTASAGERRGMAMAGARDFMVAGSPNYSPPGQVNRGQASVITFASSGQPVMAPLATGAPAGAEAGSSVATDGHRIAVGAPGTGGGSGAVSLFEPNGGGGWTEVNGVFNPDVVAGAGDRFGSAIAIDGDCLVVGAALDGQYGFWAGRAWVFQRDLAGNWSNPSELQPTTEGGALGAFDLFGWAVDIDGDRIVVSEPGDDQAGSGAGAVHVFEWHGSSWTWTGKAVPDSGDFPVGVEGNLGFSVALDGDRIAAGAPAPTISPGSGAGSVSVFARSAGSPLAGHPDRWGRIARIVPADSTNDDEFGLAVQWRSDELIIGSGQTDRIHFYAGGDGGSVWTETSRILNPLDTQGEGFGRSFAVTRDELAAGVPFADSESGELVFFRRPGAWHPVSAWQWSGDSLGSALAIDGDTAVVGADRHTIPAAAGTEHGGAYVLVRTADGHWNMDAEILTADVEDPGARFGAAVAIHGDRILVGAPLHIDAGAAWSFARQHDGSWLTKRLPATTTAGDQFGASVDLDGSLAVIGAPFSSILGKTHVYRFETGNLIPVLVKSLDAPTTWLQNLASDKARFGASVSLDGDTLAVGAPGYDLASLDSGIVAIHHRNRGGFDQWGLAKTVDGLPSSVASGFGESLDVEGNWLIVGAPDYQPSPGVSTGAAHLFRRDTGGLGNWGRSQILLPHDPVDGMDFGRVVAIADEWIAVGSPGLTLNGSPSGGVEMFLFGGSADMPAERGMLIPGHSNTSRFGSSLALGSRTLLVGEQWTGAVPATGPVAIYLLADHRQRWGFDQFGMEIFSLANEATLWGDQADFDRDGLSTMLEYLMGTNPLSRQSSPLDQVPLISHGAIQDFLRLRYRQASWAAGSTYSLQPEWSPDLSTWYRSGDGPTGNPKIIEKVVVMADDEDPHVWIIDALLPLSTGEPQAFMRLVAEKHDSP